MKKFILIIILVSAALTAQNEPFKTYYPGGKIESEIAYTENIRDGEAKFYYENGNLKEERYYVGGRVEGVVKRYTESGKLKELINIENGRREGPTSLFDDEGKYIADVFYSEGRLFVEEPVVEETPVVADGNRTQSAEEKKPVERGRKSVNTEGMMLPPDIEEERDYEDDPAIFLTADVLPEPLGGMETIYKKLIYPELAKEKGIQGTVKILASIDEFGNVTSAEVIEGIGFGCDAVARYAVYYTRFKPAMQKGKPVKIQTTIPIEFKLTKEIMED